MARSPHSISIVALSHHTLWLHRSAVAHFRRALAHPPLYSSLAAVAGAGAVTRPVGAARLRDGHIGGLDEHGTVAADRLGAVDGLAALTSHLLLLLPLPLTLRLGRDGNRVSRRRNTHRSLINHSCPRIWGYHASMPSPLRYLKILLHSSQKQSLYHCIRLSPNRSQHADFTTSRDLTRESPTPEDKTAIRSSSATIIDFKLNTGHRIMGA